MNCSHFLDQVETLMNVQQAKQSHIACKKSHYYWLIKKNLPVVYLTTKEEYTIRQAIQKTNEDEKMQVIKSLVSWIEEHPNANAQKVPEISILIINSIHNTNIVRNAALERKKSWRNSLRRLSVISNRIVPIESILRMSAAKKRVKFKAEPTVFCIDH